MANGHGGQRNGAGRKPRAEKYEQPIADAERKIIDKLPSIVDAMVDAAVGLAIRETDKDGETRTYIRPPDVKAGMYLMNRIMGAPVTQIAGEDSQPLNASGAQVIITLPDNGRGTSPESDPDDSGDPDEDSGDADDALGEE